MVGIILIIVGVIFIASGVFAGGVIGSMGGVVPEAATGIMSLSQNIFFWAFAGTGGLLTLLGVFALIRSRRSAQQTQTILAEGVESVGRVTYLDRNYSVQVNNRPIYTIVEYVYKDSLGQQYTNRVTNASTEQVIRSGLQVGSVIGVKYLSEDPAQSTIIL